MFPPQPNAGEPVVGSHRREDQLLRIAECRGPRRTRGAGPAEGKAEGEQAEKQAIARRLKKIGLALSRISQVTGLPEGEIAKLQNVEA